MVTYLHAITVFHHNYMHLSCSAQYFGSVVLINQLFWVIQFSSNSSNSEHLIMACRNCQVGLISSVLFVLNHCRISFFLQKIIWNIPSSTDELYTAVVEGSAPIICICNLVTLFATTRCPS